MIINVNYGSGGELPILTTPASPNDVISGKEYIDGDGAKQTGTFISREDGFVDGTSLTGSYSNPRVTSIRDNAFTSCVNIEHLSFANAISVGLQTFKECSSLISLNLPSVTTINSNQAFYNCSSLTSFELPKLTTITGGNQQCMSSCTSLETVSFPLFAGTLTSYFFQGCTSLKNVNLPLVTSFGQFAFTGCTSLKTISLPNAIKISTIFNNCSNLRYADCPKVTTVGGRTFENCTSLYVIDFTNSTKSTFENSTFKNCTNLTMCIIRAEEVCSASYDSVFELSKVESGTGYIYVPQNLVSSYQDASNWSKYSSQFRAFYVATSAADREAKLIDDTISNGSLIIWDDGTWDYDLNTGTKYTVKGASV